MVERIKVFNIETQLTEKEVLEVKILSNIQKESGNGGVFMSLFEFLNKKWVFWVDEFGLSANIIDKKYKEFRILLLGDTGTFKTTFLAM